LITKELILGVSTFLIAKYATGSESEQTADRALEAILRLPSTLILAWSDFPQDATRWRFDGS
jgi:hypothetical protein